MQACFFLCTSLCCALQVLHLLQIKGSWQPYVKQVYRHHFSDTIFYLCLSDFSNSHSISDFLIILGCHEAHPDKTRNLAEKCVCSDCSNQLFSISLSLFSGLLISQDTKILRLGPLITLQGPPSIQVRVIITHLSL